MKRRNFIGLLGGAVAFPFAAHAQQDQGVRRIAVLQPFAIDNPEKPRVEAFLQELQRLGWTDGRNLQIEYRWETSDLRKAAIELVAWSPEVILVSSTQAMTPLQQATKRVPIVFTQVADPVSAGFVASSGKAWRQHNRVHGFRIRNWREMARTAQGNRTQPGAGRGHQRSQRKREYWPARCDSVRCAFVQGGGEPTRWTDGKDIERTVTEFARGSNCGLIAVASPLINNNSNLIISLAAQHRLPATYPWRSFVADGGLICYGPDPIDAHRKAAGYVDRILKGEKPADLPVQAPTKYETVINLKTAKALGLTVPSSLLARVDEIIEQSMSAFGTKRTRTSALQMSAYDPKRTYPF